MKTVRPQEETGIVPARSAPLPRSNQTSYVSGGSSVATIGEPRHSNRATGAFDAGSRSSSDPWVVSPAESIEPSAAPVTVRT